MASSLRTGAALFVVGSAALWVAQPTRAALWPPIKPAELAMTAPTVEPGADVEYLEVDIRVHDDGMSLKLEGYVRAKVFTERGRQALAGIAIVHNARHTVDHIEARTITPAGTATEVQAADRFRRTVVKAEGTELRSTTFGLPLLERLGIVEYRWREKRTGDSADFERLVFQYAYPIHSITYHIRPPDVSVLSAAQFNGRFAPLVKERGGYYAMSMTNVPAYRAEPMMPSRWAVQPWVLLYYRRAGEPTEPGAFWRRLGVAEHFAMEQTAVASQAMRAEAETAVAGATTVEEKVKAILKTVRTRIRRWDLEPASTGARTAPTPNKSAAMAFDRGEGSAADAFQVFVSLARAVGLDVRYARASTRGDVASSFSMMLPFMYNQRIAAIKDGETWVFVDPTNVHDPAGHLRWTQEGCDVFIADPKQAAVARTPSSPPEWSHARRTASFTLSDDGTLEGDVRYEFRGFLGIDEKESDARLSAEQRAKRHADAISERLRGAEVSKVVVDAVTDPYAPYAVTAHVRVAGYALVAGSRMLVDPSFFEKGRSPTFTSDERRHPIFFRYGAFLSDAVTITLPPGFEIETLEAPPQAQWAGVGNAQLRLAAAADGRSFVMLRALACGYDGQLEFAASQHANAKAFFDQVRRLDEHRVSLRRRPVDR